jgi:non-ribosomal peptide synthetase component F
MADLPDPCADLHWSAFRGAIQDIFSANAAEHPDRVCVVETASSTAPRRAFTYRQIDEASNVLAHHLLQAGIQLGDVVMSYSFRGVDLVVTFMGILKAGGTICVIDPLYPPDRQIIYLDVAKPRALLVIDKATKEAGQLSEKVRAFIDEHLELRTEVGLTGGWDLTVRAGRGTIIPKLNYLNSRTCFWDSWIPIFSNGRFYTGVVARKLARVALATRAGDERTYYFA